MTVFCVLIDDCAMQECAGSESVGAEPCGLLVSLQQVAGPAQHRIQQAASFPCSPVYLGIDCCLSVLILCA